jgi:hypothetical protein
MPVFLNQVLLIVYDVRVYESPMYCVRVYVSPMYYVRVYVSLIMDDARVYVSPMYDPHTP